MPDSDRNARQQTPAPGPGEAESGPLRDPVREIVHSLNGALNNLSLNIELLDKLGAGGDEARRERYVASLRRATREIQEIVERQILPLARGSRPRS